MKRYSKSILRAAVMLLLAAMLAGCGTAAKKTDPFIFLSASWSADYGDAEVGFKGETESFQLLRDGKPVGIPIPGSPRGWSEQYHSIGFGALWSLDGSVGLMIASEDDLYLVRGDTVTRIAEDVYNAALSAGGTHAAWYDHAKRLWYMDLASGSPVLVEEQHERANYEALSPNGKYLVYSVAKAQDDYAVCIFDGKTSRRLTEGEALKPLAVSDSGELVLCANGADMELYLLDGEGGRRALCTDPVESYGAVYLNSTHSQLIWHGDDGWYFLEEGGAPVALPLPDQMEIANILVLPEGCREYAPFAMRYCHTLPALSLKEHFYDVGDELWYLDDAAAAVRIPEVGALTSTWISRDGKTLYCTDEAGGLYRVTDNAPGSPEKLEQSAVSVVGVDPEGGLWYIADATIGYALWYDGADREPEEISGSIGRAVMRADGQVFFSRDMRPGENFYVGDVYTAAPGEVPQKLLSDIVYLGMDAQAVYAMSEPGLEQVRPENGWSDLIRADIRTKICVTGTGSPLRHGLSGSSRPTEASRSKTLSCSTPINKDRNEKGGLP